LVGEGSVPKKPPFEGLHKTSSTKGGIKQKPPLELWH
jgi:hypothetical protein